MSGYQVQTAKLYEYSHQLAGNKTAVAGVKGKVDQADVGNQSWGVVGIFVKHMYTDLLGEMKDLLTDMENGLQSASDKIKRAGEFYDQTEDDHCRSWKDVMGQLDSIGTGTKPGVAK
ncbi:hypothetical protein [Amycolatopsis benzoatilytica]|uniref:hypothetical protein n=1 Tax=Amycolatopsis benzoatilytica TaxID=346045 RepID=UPI000367D6EC|nr:hypothetical protein [Amycolatopsis benzoatilytica]